jgi:glycosyltransferase involved in cell wall biosynthesis
MRIGINLLYMLPGKVGGTETYAAGLLKGLAEISAKDDFVVFMNRESANWPIPNLPNFSRVVCPVKAHSRLQRYLYEQIRLPRLLSKYNIDIVHSLGYVSPLFAPCSSIVTVHDLNFFALKHTMSYRKRIFLRFFSLQSIRRSNHVITISRFSKNEICKKTKLDQSRITVTHLAPQKKSHSAALINDWAELKTNYGISKPYVIAIGGGTPHKNIPRLIMAFASIKDKFPHSLVLMGRLPGNVNLSAEYMGKELKDRIFTTGYVPEEHVLPLLGNADLFVFPSLYEGFGLPVIEAQQAGVAVICSVAGPLPEVAGDGALYFDPISVEDIAHKLQYCLRDSNLRLQLVSKGRENLCRFSWAKTALSTMQVYRRVVKAGKVMRKN